MQACRKLTVELASAPLDVRGRERVADGELSAGVRTGEELISGVQNSRRRKPLFLYEDK